MLCGAVVILKCHGVSADVLDALACLCAQHLQEVQLGLTDVVAQLQKEGGWIGWVGWLVGGMVGWGDGWLGGWLVGWMGGLVGMFTVFVEF